MHTAEAAPVGDAFLQACAARMARSMGSMTHGLLFKCHVASSAISCCKHAVAAA